MSRLFPMNLAIIATAFCSVHLAFCQPPAQIPLRTPLTTRAPQTSGDAPLDLYNTLLASTQSAAGTLHLGLNGFDGRTVGHVSGQAAHWHVDPGTSIRVSFSLRGETWDKLTFDFDDHPLTVQLAIDTPAPGTLTISRITYGRDGKVRDVYAPGDSLITNFDRRGLSGGTPIGFYSDLLSSISLPPRLSTLLGTDAATKGPLLIVDTELRPDKGDQLSLVLNPTTNIPLGSHSAAHCNNSLVFQESVTLPITSLAYERTSGRLNMATASFVTALSGGCVAAGGTAVLLESGTRLTSATLALGESSRGQEPHVLLDDGDFRAVILRGTAAALGTASTHAVMIHTQDSGVLRADHLTVGVGPNGHDQLSMTDASFDFGRVSGQLAFDSGDFLNFSAPALHVSKLTATWTDASDPLVAATIEQCAISITDGLLTLGSTAQLPLSTGQAHLADLSINTAQIPLMTGGVTDLNTALASNDTIGNKGRFSLGFAAGSTFQIVSSDNARFLAQSAGPHGHFLVSGPVANGEINFAAGGDLTVDTGNVEVSMTRGTDSRLSGQMVGSLTISKGSLAFGDSTLTPLSRGDISFAMLGFAAESSLTGPLSSMAFSLGDSGTLALSPATRLRSTKAATAHNITDGATTVITDSGITGGILLHLPFDGGNALFGADVSLALGNGSVDARLIRSQQGVMTGTLTLSSQLASNLLPLDDNTVLPIAAGSNITSDQLQLTASGAIVGPITTGHLALSTNATLGATNGRIMTLAASSFFNIQAANALSFVEGEHLPSGGGNLSAKFSLLRYQRTPKVTLQDGELTARVSRESSGPLKWLELTVTGNQDGSYGNLKEMPRDEYVVQAKFPDGKTQMVIARNRSMLISDIPTAVGSSFSFDNSGNIQRAQLAHDTTIFNVPLLAGTSVEVDIPNSNLIEGVLSADTSIAGVAYSKGCVAHLPPTDSDKQVSPCEVVTTLAARITTSNDFLSGANDPLTGKPDDIWLDVGPKGWLISDSGDFSRGATTVVSVDPSNVSGNDCSALTPAIVPLLAGDIVKVRMEKKGISLPKICGVAEGPDSLVDAGLLLPTKPSDALNTMTAAIQLKRQELMLQKQAIEALTNEIGQLQSLIDQAQGVINQGASLTQRVADLKNQLVSLNASIVDQTLRVGDTVCKNVTVSSGACWFLGPICLVTKLVCSANTVLIDLNNRFAQAQKDLNNTQADVEAFAIKLQAALAAKSTNLALQATKVSLLETDKLQYAALNRVADILDSAISDLKTLIDNAIPGLDLPLPGQWKPETVTLIVNGKDYFTVHNDYGRLRQGHSEWETASRPIGAAEYFVQGMRTNINTAGCGPVEGDQECGWDTFLTTPFAKMRGFSGWDNLNSLGNVTVTGILRHDPSPGEDAYVSLDLQVLSVAALGSSFTLGDHNQVHSTRFIRVEYLHEGDQRYDTQHEHWKIGDTIRVTGPVKRDRDRTTFFEIHPRGSSNIGRISQGG